MISFDKNSRRGRILSLFYNLDESINFESLFGSRKIVFHSMKRQETDALTRSNSLLLNYQSAKIEDIRENKISVDIVRRKTSNYYTYGTFHCSNK